MICVMVMKVFDDCYCWVWMNPMGPGVMYEMFVAEQLLCWLPMGMIMVFVEFLLTCYMMNGTLHEQFGDKVLCLFCF